MYPIDFISYYSFENFDFVLADDNKIDFTIDNSGNIDFAVDVTTPVDEYIPVLNNLKPRPDNVTVYGDNYLITEDDIPISSEDGYFLIY